MADLDAELLALAGDTSEEEQAIPTTERDDVPAAPPARSTPRTPAKKRARRRDDSEDEGEASSESEPDSAPMSESASEAGGESDDEGPLFPVEGKFYTEQDRAEILALPEVEREAILAERATILERKHQDNILKRLYQGYKTTDDAMARKRKAAAALDDGEGRKSGRQRTTRAGRRVGEASAPLEAYKAQREHKDQQRRAGAAAGAGADRRPRGRRASPDSASPDAADAPSDVEWDAGRARAREADEPADLADYNRVLVGRVNFAQVCFYPTFEKLIPGCYVRVAVGPDPKTDEPCYRMAKIEAIETQEDQPYAIEGPNGKNFVTNQYVLASVGRARRAWPFIYCSNTRLAERELARYKGMLATEGGALPTKRALLTKIDDINRLIRHTFTEAELQEKLRRSGVLRQRANDIERQTLLVKRTEAESLGDLGRAEHIDAELRALDGPKLAFNTSLTRAVPTQPGRPKEPTAQERAAEAQRAQRRAQQEQIRKAQVAEHKAQLARRAAVERGEAAADPFARVKVMAKTHFDVHNTGRVLAPRAGTPVANGKAAAAKPKPVDGAIDTAELKVELKNATFDWAQYDQMAALAKACAGKDGARGSVFKRKPCVDEILASIDCGLDDLFASEEVKSEAPAVADG